jgi:hypothetical protein
MSEFDEARARAWFEAEIANNGTCWFNDFDWLKATYQSVAFQSFDSYEGSNWSKLFRVAAEYCPETKQFLLRYADLKDQVDAFKAEYPQVYKETNHV